MSKCCFALFCVTALLVVLHVMAPLFAQRKPTGTENLVKVKAYRTKAGVEVREHYRTRPDATKDNNLGHQSGGR